MPLARSRAKRDVFVLSMIKFELVFGPARAGAKRLIFDNRLVIADGQLERNYPPEASVAQYSLAPGASGVCERLWASLHRIRKVVCSPSVYYVRDLTTEKYIRRLEILRGLSLDSLDFWGISSVRKTSRVG